MNKNGKSSTDTAFATLVVYMIIGIPLSYWTRRNLDFWLTAWKHHAVYVPLWLSFMLSVILNKWIIVLNLIGELGRYVL